MWIKAQTTGNGNNKKSEIDLAPKKHANKKGR
jgi:hypothetical protein